MGKRGPKPKPTALKKLEGTFRPDRAAVAEAKVLIGRPEMTPNVRRDKLARACWETLTPKLEEVGLLSHIDGIALEGLCLIYARARRADDAVAKFGLVIKRPDGLVKANPAVAMSRNAWVEVRHFLAEFGLTPATRSRVDALPVITPPANGEASPTGVADTERFLFGQIVGEIRPKTA